MFDRAGNRSGENTADRLTSLDAPTGDSELPIVVTGTVVRGDQRGRELGYPTANLRPGSSLRLPFGVYAGRALGHPAAVSVGVRPTFGQGLEPLVEAYILDWNGELYDREISVELVERLRGEVQFHTVEELVAQMERDVAAVRARIGA